MSALFHQNISLDLDYDARTRTLYECKLRKVPGVKSALIHDGVLSVYTTSPKLLVAALFKLKLISIKQRIEQKKKEAKEQDQKQIKAVGDELKSYKFKALISLCGFGVLEAVKRLSPTSFANLSIAKSVFVLLIAKDIFKEGFVGLVKDKHPNADTLTATAVLASLLSGKPESSLSLLVLSNFAEMLTISAAEKARQHISSLLGMKEKFVWLKDPSNHISKVSIDDVKVGDELVKVFR